MGDLRVDYDAIFEAARSIRADLDYVREPLRDPPVRSEVGHERLAAAMAHFEERWHPKLQAAREITSSLADSLDDSAERFQAIDTGLGRQAATL
ncbi:hypothetical protein [Mesorhizobium japonicum]|uniref:hypothetical protein n=1 Tax=Mesorhizobium japonicum TaxID=2066070 RepID=UPI003B5C7E12